MSLFGYRVEFKAGDYLHYTVTEFARESELYIRNSRVWTLHTEPQNEKDMPVYYDCGAYGLSAKYYSQRHDKKCKPIYLGRLIIQPMR